MRLCIRCPLKGKPICFVYSFNRGGGILRISVTLPNKSSTGLAFNKVWIGYPSHTNVVSLEDTTWTRCNACSHACICCRGSHSCEPAASSRFRTTKGPNLIIREPQQ
ncbi:unnamed protein product [Ectocarpus sp. 12 AP-2014]